MERESESANSLRFVVDKVSFVNKLSLLQKATTDDESPTPGYLFDQISNLTREKGSFCNDVLEYLVMRLDKKSYHVKLKVLRIMRFTVDNGHPEFRQGLRRKAHGIREATKFGGPPDRLHGNAPYILVRKEAKELSQILFDVNAEVSDGQGDVAMTTKTVMSGMGSGSRGEMQGFGNITQTEKSLSESLVGGFRSLADKVLTPTAPPTDYLSASQQQDRMFSTYKPVQFDGAGVNTRNLSGGYSSHVNSTQRNTAKSTLEKASSRVKVHKPGKVGGGWEDSDDDEVSPHQKNQEDPETFNGTDNPDEMTSIAGSETFNRLEVGSKENYKTETDLVSEIVNQQGPLLLKRRDIENFIKRCSLLNCMKVAEAIGIILVNSSFIYQLHGLQLVEALLRTDLLTTDDLMNTCCGGLAVCFQSKHGQTQVKARKIIRIMEKLCVNPSPIANIIPVGDNSIMCTSNTEADISSKEPNQSTSQEYNSSWSGNNLMTEDPGLMPLTKNERNFTGSSLLQTSSNDSDSDTFMSNFAFIKPP